MCLWCFLLLLLGECLPTALRSMDLVKDKKWSVLEPPRSWDLGGFVEGVQTAVLICVLGFWEPVQAVGDTRWAVTQPQGLVLFVLCWEAAQPTQVLKHWPQNTPIWATWQGPAGCKVWGAEPAGARSPHLQGISPTSNQELPMLSPWWAQGDSQHQAPQLCWWAEQACGRSSWSWLKSRLHVPHLAVLFDLWFLWSGEKPAYK